MQPVGLMRHVSDKQTPFVFCSHFFLLWPIQAFPMDYLMLWSPVQALILALIVASNVPSEGTLSCHLFLFDYCLGTWYGAKPMVCARNMYHTSFVQ